MKKYSALQIFAAIALLFVLFSCSYHRRHHGLDVSVSESHDSFRLRAYYDEDKTGKVQRYINRQLEPNGLFASNHDYFDVTTELTDRTKFYIKASPGKLFIEINKNENSYASYNRIKMMCQGVAEVLKEK